MCSNSLIQIVVLKMIVDNVYSGGIKQTIYVKRFFLFNFFTFLSFNKQYIFILQYALFIMMHMWSNPLWQTALKIALCYYKCKEKYAEMQMINNQYWVTSIRYYNVLLPCRLWTWATPHIIISNKKNPLQSLCSHPKVLCKTVLTIIAQHVHIFQWEESKELSLLSHNKSVLTCSFLRYPMSLKHLN